MAHTNYMTSARLELILNSFADIGSILRIKLNDDYENMICHESSGELYSTMIRSVSKIVINNE